MRRSDQISQPFNLMSVLMPLVSASQAGPVQDVPAPDDSDVDTSAWDVSAAGVVQPPTTRVPIMTIPGVSDPVQDATDANTDLSWARRKNGSVNISGINPVLAQYINTLPEQFKSSLVITSGNDQQHATHSKHYHNNAVDIRFNPELHRYIQHDDYAARLGLRVLNPNHGTAPHTHLELRQQGGTVLTPDETATFNRWKETLPENLRYEGDYDLKGFWKKYPDFRVRTQEDHLTDEFKLPNHESFSNESRYYNGQTPGAGGYWQEDTYVPNPKSGPPVTPVYSVGGQCEDYITDPRGQWDHSGEKTLIPSNRITMKGVNYPVVGIDDFGKMTVMLPGEDYRFPGKQVKEIPMSQFQYGAEVHTGAYPQYLPDTADRVRAGRMQGAAGGIGTIEHMQHQLNPQYFGSQQLDMHDFFNRQKNITDSIPNFDPANQRHVAQFQQRYNEAYKQATGSDYFTGEGPRAFDGKFGKYTWSAPAIPQPTPQSSVKRGIRYEKLKDSLGNEYFSPIPVGDYSSSEWRNIVNTQLPEKFGNTPVLRGQPYFEMFSGPNVARTSQWKTTEEHPRPFSQLPTAPSEASANTGSKIKVTYMQTGGAVSNPFAPGSGKMDQLQLSAAQMQAQQYAYSNPAPPVFQAPAAGNTVSPAHSGGFHPVPGLFTGIGAGLEFAADYLDRTQNQADSRDRAVQAGLSQNIYGITNSSNPFGNYAVNAGPGGHYAEGGQYSEGEELDLTDDQIALLRAQGYELDLV